jgi:hypothetical protein
MKLQRVRSTRLSMLALIALQLMFRKRQFTLPFPGINLSGSVLER